MSEDNEYSRFLEDPRVPCKYGADCYRKNTPHREKYKHPPKRKQQSEDKTHTNKKPKHELKQEEKHVVSNDISDSDSNQELDQSSSSNSNQGNKDHQERNNSLKSENNKEKESNANNQKQSSSAKGNDINEKEVQTLSPSNKDINEKETSQQNSNTSPQIATNRTPKSFDKKDFIKSKFLVEMPDDFYKFWEFCKSLNQQNPLAALKNAGLYLVGPFDVLANKFSDIVEPPLDQYLVHWRYYYDIPEIQTVIRGDDSTGFHIGYFRDDPNESPVFMASNCAEKNGEIVCLGENIFAAVYLHLEDLKKKCDPFKKMQISKLQSLVKAKAEELQLNVSTTTLNMRKRQSHIVTRSLNKVGLVVPYNRKTQQGYRELSVSGKEFNTLLQHYKEASPEKKIQIKSEIEEVFRWASIATDECDFGTGIELGWDLIFTGVDEFNSAVSRFLSTSYHFLNRDAFAKIAESHMKNRRRGCKLSILE